MAEWFQHQAASGSLVLAIPVALIAGLVSWTPASLPIGGVLTVVFDVVWKLFDTIFLGGLQAFIFALLTILYFGFELSDGH